MASKNKSGKTAASIVLYRKASLNFAMRYANTPSWNANMSALPCWAFRVSKAFSRPVEKRRRLLWHWSGFRVVPKALPVPWHLDKAILEIYYKVFVLEEDRSLDFA
jgi:hypothetical protein